MPESANWQVRSQADPCTSQWGWRSDGRDWPAGRGNMTLAEIFAALDGITPEVSEAARLSLLALDDEAVRDA